MSRKPIFLFLFYLALFPVSRGFGAVSPLARNFERVVALTNSHVVITVNFTNAEPVTLRGFYYADQLPAGLEVITFSVSLNGQPVTNYTFETGQAGDVYAGCIPYRWVLERPGNFAETNPLPSQARVQIVYSVSSAVSGTFLLQQFGWVGLDRSTTNAFFGASQSSDHQAVSFLDGFQSVKPLLTITNARANLTFPAQAGVTYLIEFKDDLKGAAWQPLTNVIGTGNLMPVQDPAVLGTRRFYQIRTP